MGDNGGDATSPPAPEPPPCPPRPRPGRRRLLAAFCCTPSWSASWPWPRPWSPSSRAAGSASCGCCWPALASNMAWYYVRARRASAPGRRPDPVPRPTDASRRVRLALPEAGRAAGRRNVSAARDAQQPHHGVDRVARTAFTAGIHSTPKTTSRPNGANGSTCRRTSCDSHGSMHAVAVQARHRQEVQDRRRHLEHREERQRVTERDRQASGRAQPERRRQQPARTARSSAARPPRSGCAASGPGSGPAR